MALSPDDTARLASLKAQRDALIGGTKVTKVTHGPRSTELAAGDPDKLMAEIDRLEALEATGSRRRRGALTFRFRA